MTKQTDIDAKHTSDQLAELPKLTDKQWQFVQARLAGKNQTEAYRKAYDCARMKNTSIWRQAIEVENNPKVAAWIRAGKREYLTKAGITIDEYLQELDEAIQTYALHKAWSAHSKALDMKAKVLNAYEGHQQSGAAKDEDYKLLDEIRRTLGSDVADAARERLGYEKPKIFSKAR